MPRLPDIERRDEIVIVSATEDLDIASADAFVESALRSVPNDARGVVIDLTLARYVDSAGIRALFTMGDALARRQQLIRIVIPPDAAVRRVLGIVGLDSAAPVVETLDEAISAVEAAVAAEQ